MSVAEAVRPAVSVIAEGLAERLSTGSGGALTVTETEAVAVRPEPSEAVIVTE